MDSGPVDAGPAGELDYDLPSPLQRSKREDNLRNGAHSRSPSREHHNQYFAEGDGNQYDPPLFQRVGAVSGEELEDSQYDGSAHMSPHTASAETEQMASTPTIHHMHKFTLYETSTRYWVAGSDLSDRHHRMLRIDRTTTPGQLNVVEDDVVYSKQDLAENLIAIDDGNRSSGGLRIKTSFWGLLGFIRFTEAYYMLIVTKRQQVAMLGGHYIYQIEGTELIPLTTGNNSRFARDRNPEEVRFLGILASLDLSKSFYFSYTYDITRTLQHNICAQRSALNAGKPACDHDFNSMFVWNHHLLKPARNSLKHPYDWCLPIIHGFVDQAALDVFGRSIFITIVGRRSRYFAGARFLKRGVNDLGHVANDVETEQIVSEMLTTSFHAPGPKPFANPGWTSYVHHRGSIPLYWTQDNSGVNPKPDIDLNLPDPFYQPAALHFDDLFERYGCPVFVLNLIKSRERAPRESKLLYAYQDCIEYLNQSLPSASKIMYKAFDMSRASKMHGGDVIGNLEIIARDVLDVTGFFHNGYGTSDSVQMQNGVARTNCVDCLDRTNAAQFVIGKKAFGAQLKALGVLQDDDVKYDTDAVNIFTHMFHDHGDTIAVQYGGSHLVNTMATYRKLNQWQSHSRDMVESFKRYYHNSFLDNQRQEAYNLFLGNYIWAQGQPMLWDLVTDYYLHHSDPRNWLNRPRRDYYNWFTPQNLQRRIMPTVQVGSSPGQNVSNISKVDDYWLEYYRPAALSSFLKVYSYRMNSTTKYLPDRSHAKDAKPFDFSPFKPRLDPNRVLHEQDTHKPVRKGVKIIDPIEEADENVDSTSMDHITAYIQSARLSGSSVRDFAPLGGHKLATPRSHQDKAQMHLWSLDQIYTHSLRPTVTVQEAAEYERYIEHPLTLPLVTSSEDTVVANTELAEYLQRGLSDGTSFLEADNGEDQLGEVIDKDMNYFLDYLEERQDVLTVTEDDAGKKRYKAYRQWLRGKSLFKQSKVDPEFVPGH